MFEIEPTLLSGVKQAVVSLAAILTTASRDEYW